MGDSSLFLVGGCLCLCSGFSLLWQPTVLCSMPCSSVKLIEHTPWPLDFCVSIRVSANQVFECLETSDLTVLLWSVVTGYFPQQLASPFPPSPVCCTYLTLCQRLPALYLHGKRKSVPLTQAAHLQVSALVWADEVSMCMSMCLEGCEGRWLRGRLVMEG